MSNVKASGYVAETGEAAAPRGPSVRRVLLTGAVLSVAVAIWAAVERTGVPFLVLAPLVLVGPFPWRRFFTESRGGYALWWFCWCGVWFGVFDSLRGDRHAGVSGLLFGLVMALVGGVTWEKTPRPSRLRHWLRIRRLADPS